MQQDQLAQLIHQYFNGALTPDEMAAVESQLLDNPAARKEFWTIAKSHVRICLALTKAAGSSDSALNEPGKEPVAAPSRSGGEQAPPRTNPPVQFPISNPSTTVPGSTFHISQFFLHPVTLWSLVGTVVVGVLAILFWPAPTHVATQAATLAHVTDARWQRGFAPVANALTSGERLKLESGSAEITFNSQARIIVSSPAELTIVDATACRLATGRLTAQVPAPAKGFKVHTPDGTVTDLGTEFGVYVKTGPEIPESDEPKEQTEATGPQPGMESPITEVHVFKGQVDIVTADQLAEASRTKIENRKSKILSAGQAVTLSDNKVQPLPAADPFKFALDMLNGKSRQVLLSDDFETYELGRQDKAIGPWIVQGGTRKGQGVYVIDPAATIAELSAIPGISIPYISPSPANGQRVVKCVSSMQFPKNTYPLLAREIDCREFAGRCQVLVEFDLFAQGDWTEPSLAFAAEVGQASGIALWQNSDAAGPKIEWQPNRWYRVRVLLDVADGAVRSVRAERSLWAGAEGWVRDSAFMPPIPQVDWKTPPRYVLFGFPVPPTGKSGGHPWFDNIRIEVISEK